VLDGELVAQHLDEFDVGAARGARSNAHCVGASVT
jgi:hypothetical protein